VGWPSASSYSRNSSRSNCDRRFASNAGPDSLRYGISIQVIALSLDFVRRGHHFEFEHALNSAQQVSLLRLVFELQEFECRAKFDQFGTRLWFKFRGDERRTAIDRSLASVFLQTRDLLD
jgi:hypothetical protein